MNDPNLVIFEIQQNDMDELSALLGPIAYGLATPLVAFFNRKMLEQADRQRAREQLAAERAEQSFEDLIDGVATSDPTEAIH